ncbi:MAG: arginine--tRNA ligase [Epsilonproteobacteria bacterium]|nr:arginine--tRNA ligase [Campylobacterota bacterium]
MNVMLRLKQEIKVLMDRVFQVHADQLNAMEFKINFDREDEFGDVSCNVAMLCAKKLGKNPREIAARIKDELEKSDVKDLCQKVSIAGPGFINILLTPQAWIQLTCQLYQQHKGFFTLKAGEHHANCHLEFVSANPTGPLHLGSGRNAIIGDVLGRVLLFLGHSVHREYYINDAGNQMDLLAQSFRVRCYELLELPTESIPEGGYQGAYLIDIARECVTEFGKELMHKDDAFFLTYVKDHLLQMIEHDLRDYHVHFDKWFSERSLHEDGSLTDALQLLEDKELMYEKDGALWFKSSEFGDDKDRVVKKQDGSYTYIASDIAYHKKKFDGGYDIIIDVLGHDHHGYVRRLKATMKALGYDADRFDVILYQLVNITHAEQVVKMSKRSGNFATLREIIDAVGVDVARFFYLNRKADQQLDFDLSVALQKSDENPVFYIQYAYVRTNSVMAKAAQQSDELKQFVNQLEGRKLTDMVLKENLGTLQMSDCQLIKKIFSLHDILRVIAANYQVHLLSYYAWELAHTFHTYYANNRIIDPNDMTSTRMRLLMTHLVNQTLGLCLETLGLSKPEKM